jgi:tetratricopeptide (TPR) repeat protein
MRRSRIFQTAFVRASVVVLALLMLPTPDWATCGGGGGGGVGGMSTGSAGGGGRMEQETYPVPWRQRMPQDAPVKEGLVVYWFPTGADEFRRSSLRNSRLLALNASHCVSMEVAAVGSPSGQKFAGDAKLPLVVLAQADGTVIGKAENKNGFLKIDQVEELLGNEMKRREETLKAELKEAKEKEKSGDTQGAIPIYRTVLEQKCLFPGQAKNAAKALKKLGVEDVGEVQDGPVLDPAKSATIERTMRRGLVAELQAKYPEAERWYAQARRMDPADPAPLRYLGELYRHDIGHWDKAHEAFDAILKMPADPISRAVALHGLGKMTVHEGAFKEGLALMEKSVQTYPLPLAYRNLAVYWNSEGDAVKTNHYVEEALKLEPTDPYNLVFAAVFKAASGHGDEALKIARDNEALLPASYNLAAIYAQNGQKEKALELLKRHFFEYERYQAVRSKEMMEARVDFVFVSLRQDPVFVALTSGADGRLPLPKGASSSGARSKPGMN